VKTNRNRSWSQSSAQNFEGAKKFWGTKMFDVRRITPFVWKNATQSAKWLYFLKMWGAWPLWPPSVYAYEPEPWKKRSPEPEPYSWKPRAAELEPEPCLWKDELRSRSCVIFTTVPQHLENTLKKAKKQVTEKQKNSKT